MPLYEYTAKKSPTETLRGTIEAASEPGAIQKLTEQGLFPIAVIETRSGTTALHQKSVRLPARVLIFFTREIADLLGSGVNLVKALHLIAEQPGHRKLQFIARILRDRVRDGAPFSESLQSFPHVFQPLYVNIVRSGEISGQLDAAMNRLAVYFERTDTLRAKVIASLIYPAFLVLMSLVALGVLMFYVVPEMQPMFEDIGGELPTITRVLVWISAWCLNLWPLAVIALVGFFFLRYQVERTPRLKGALQARILKIPLVGPFFSSRYLAEIFQSLESLIENGVATVEAVKVTAKGCSNLPYRAALEQLAEDITHGSSFSAGLRQHPLFPPRIHTILLVGEETGSIGHALGKVALGYTHAFEQHSTVLTKLIGPVFVIIISMLILLIIIAMLLPILSLNVGI